MTRLLWKDSFGMNLPVQRSTFQTFMYVNDLLHNYRSCSRSFLQSYSPPVTCLPMTRYVGTKPSFSDHRENVIIPSSSKILHRTKIFNGLLCRNLRIGFLISVTNGVFSHFFGSELKKDGYHGKRKVWYLHLIDNFIYIYVCIYIKYLLEGTISPDRNSYP